MEQTAWGKLARRRAEPLWDRFPGFYRAQVTGTDDPLNVGRVRVRVPDLHDADLPIDQCPWAVPAWDLGGPRAGRFTAPSVGDLVWVGFERGYPHAPVWFGAAEPTRRRSYAYQQVHVPSPVSVNDDGLPAAAPRDFDRAWLPADGRPMRQGQVDRYGSFDLFSAVGFFPQTHAAAPPPSGHDAVQGAAFAQQRRPPEVNAPDLKYVVRATKYGHFHLLGDQGYVWKRDGDAGEFAGDARDDEAFEARRWRYLQRLFNEGRPADHDQRRQLLQTRYGSFLELRDVGWGQRGPIASQTRPDEYGEPRTISAEADRDERWWKLRTKAGMLDQAMDMGAHPAEDAYVRRRLIDEVGSKADREHAHWHDRDARQMRRVTRHGFKLVLDDRGSDARRADRLESPRGNGVLIKGRRSPGAGAEAPVGDPRGFWWEFNENDQANHSCWGSPLGQAIELNDRYQYMMMAAALGKRWTRRWRGLKENEFSRRPTMLARPERAAYHLKLDHENEYLRLKTRGNRGASPRGDANPSGVARDELQQGLEARDGSKGEGPWVEMVDCQHRGFWLSKAQHLGVWRGRRSKQLYLWIDDAANQIVIYNNHANGKVSVYGAGDVDVSAGRDLNLHADRFVSVTAGEKFRLQAGGAQVTVSDQIRTNVDFNGPNVNAFLCGGPIGCPNPGGESVDPPAAPLPPERLEPTDRGQTYNGPFEECPRSEVEHALQR